MRVQQFFSLLVMTGSMFIALNSNSQAVAINTDGSSADASAALDIKTTSKGLLIPRMLSGQRTVIPAPAEGLLVYQTDAPAGFYVFKGGAWTPVLSGPVSGTLNFIPKFTPNGTSLGNSLLIDDGTNVGLGTPTPNNKLEVVQTGSSAAILGSNTQATGPTSGVIGTSGSNANGIGASGGVSGVVGQVTLVAPGGYSAGVRGLNNGTGGTGIGVIGYQAGSGWGVYGETPSGFGVYGLTTNNSAVSSGVRGETFSTNGIGVEAKYSGAGLGIALEVDNGAIRVAGVNKAAFVHTATPANKLSANGTDVDNPMCNNDPNCFLIITQLLNPSGIVYNNSPMGVYYNTIRNKWEIFNENNVAIPNNAQFNVLVIKQ